MPSSSTPLRKPGPTPPPEDRRAYVDRRMAEIEALAADIGKVTTTDKTGPELVAEQRR